MRPQTQSNSPSSVILLSRARWRWIFLAFCWVGASLPAAGAAEPGLFNVREYGAQGTATNLDTAAFQRAVDACAAAGGGQVRVPPGRYVCGTVFLKSRVTLFLEAGAVLTGTTNLGLYRGFSANGPEPRLARSRWHRGLLVAEDVEGVEIAGQGTIDGGRVRDPRGEEGMRGPHTVLLGHCRAVTIRDVSIVDSANYAVLFYFSDQVDVRGVKFVGGWDGVHFRGSPARGCRDVNIVGCEFHTGDDSIAGSYWERVLIQGCIVNSSCNGIRLIGPADGLIIHDCLFYGPGTQPHRTSARTNMLAGICLQPSGWEPMPGSLDDVSISDITMRRVTTPLFVALKKDNPGGTLHVERLTATGAYRAAASVESWGEAPFTNVVFRDVSVEFTGGQPADAVPSAIHPPGVDARPLPCWGLFARNVARLELDHVRFRCAEEDARPVLRCEDVGQLTLDAFDFRRGTRAANALVFTNVGQVRLRGTPVLPGEMPGAEVVEFR